MFSQHAQGVAAPALVYGCAALFLQASVSPGESGLVTVVGTGILKVFRLSEQTLKQQPLNANRRDTLSFTCQAWVPLGDKGADAAAGSDAAKAAAGDRERQLLGTLDGEILLFEVSSAGLLLHATRCSAHACTVCIPPRLATAACACMGCVC
jgi:hypothetical protein